MAGEGASFQGAYAEIGGRKVWVSERGSGPTLVMLHGGLGYSEQMLEALGPILGQHYRLIGFDRIGQGRTADDGRPFDYARMGEEVAAFLEWLGGGPHVLVGWSDGGIAALFTAMQRPDLVQAMVLIGANFDADGQDKFDVAPGSDIYRMLETDYALRAPEGGSNFPSVAERMFALWWNEPRLTPEDLGRIKQPALVMQGEDDHIHVEHAVAMWRALPRGQLAIVPNASHGVIFEKPDFVSWLIVDFLRGLAQN